MTEEEWLKCTRPTELLRPLVGTQSDRKMRLFVCHLVRRKVEDMADVVLAHAVETAVQYADAAASEQDRQRHRETLEVRQEEWVARQEFERAADVRDVKRCLDGQMRNWFTSLYHRRRWLSEETDLLRDIFGNPFRPVTRDPRWLSETVVALASGIYAERAFDRLPILADALEEAGCDNADVLSHCRGPGPHVRGCWVVDLLLGKE